MYLILRIIGEDPINHMTHFSEVFIQQLHVNNLHTNEKDDRPRAVLDVLSSAKEDPGHMIHGGLRPQTTVALDHL